MPSELPQTLISQAMNMHLFTAPNRLAPSNYKPGGPSQFINSLQVTGTNAPLQLTGNSAPLQLTGPTSQSSPNKKSTVDDLLSLDATQIQTGTYTMSSQYGQQSSTGTMPSMQVIYCRRDSNSVIGNSILLLIYIEL
jgi:hypothetical protein